MSLDQNTPSQEGLTVEQAVQRLQERRNAKASSTPSNAVNEDAGDNPEVLNPTNKQEEGTADGNNPDTPVEGESDEGAEEIFKVTVKDESGADVEMEVPASELLKGYMRQSDYTRKRAKDSEEHKAKVAEVTTKAADLDIILQGAISQMTAEVQAFNNVNWKELQQTDINEYNRLRLAHSDALGRVNQRRAQLEGIRRYQEERQNLELAVQLKEQTEILKGAIPDWTTRSQELEKYLNDEGITDLRPFVNAKMALLVHKAKQFDDLQSKKQTIIKHKIERVVPTGIRSSGTAPHSEANNEHLAALERKARASGSIQDATAVREYRRSLQK